MAHCARKHGTAQDDHMVVRGLAQTLPDIYRNAADVIEHWATIGCCRGPHADERQIRPGYQGHTLRRGTEPPRRCHLAYELFQLCLFNGTAPSIESLDFRQVGLYT